MYKVALITGSRRGIGYGIAKSLAQEGYCLVINDIVDQIEIQDKLEELKKNNIDVLYCQADISDRKQRERMLNQIKTHFGCCHVLVNNAGVAPIKRADILEATEESYERVLKINLQGPYFLTQAVANWMIEQKKTNECGFYIINISSISAEVASPSRGEYCISKAGVHMAAQLWAVRLAEFGIPVYEIQPGIIETDMTAPVKEKYDQLIKQGLIPQNRWGVPEDIGKTVAMLVRGDLAYSTGQVIRVDGGLTIQQL